METFRRTHAWAESYGVSEVTPWVAIASGWQSTGPKSRVWVFEWDYDTAFSAQLGAQINDPWYGDHPDDYAPWHQATAVIFFPRPFDSDDPAWPKHFVAYVRGAHGIDDLP